MASALNLHCLHTQHTYLPPSEKCTAFSIYLIRNHEHIANITYSPSIIYSLGPETKLGIPILDVQAELWWARPGRAGPGWDGMAAYSSDPPQTAPSHTYSTGRPLSTATTVLSNITTGPPAPPCQHHSPHSLSQSLTVPHSPSQSTVRHVPGHTPSSGCGWDTGLTDSSCVTVFRSGFSGSRSVPGGDGGGSGNRSL